MCSIRTGLLAFAVVASALATPALARSSACPQHFVGGRPLPSSTRSSGPRDASVRITGRAGTGCASELLSRTSRREDPMLGLRLFVTVATILLLAPVPITLAQSGGGGGGSGGGGSGGASATGSGGPATGSPQSPGSTGATGNPESTGSTNRQQGASGGGSTGNQTGLGNIGPQTEREQRAQEQSDQATKGICNRC